MKFKSTGLLLLAAGALGAYIYFVEIKKAEKDETAKAESEKIVAGLDEVKLKGFSFKSSSGIVKLERSKDGQWSLIEPIKDLADGQTIQGLLTGLANERTDQVVSEGETDLKPYGLDQPVGFLELQFEDGTAKRVLIGAEGALPGKIYLMREGEKKVLFANAYFKSQLEKSAKDLRDKRLFRGKPEDVAGLRMKYLSAGGGAYELKKKDGVWLLEKPWAEKADQETVNQLVNSLTSLRATEAVSEDSSDLKEIKKYQLEKPQVVATLLDKDGKVLTEIKISGKKENFSYGIAQGAKPVFQLYAATVDSLSKKPQEFRDRKSAFEFKREDVARIEVNDAGGGAVELEKKAVNWELVKSDPAKQVNQIQVTSLIDKIALMRADDFIEGKDAAAATKVLPGKAQLVFKDAKGASLLEVKWSEKGPRKELAAVSTNKGPRIYGVNPAVLSGLPLSMLVEDKNKKVAPKEDKPGPAKPELPQ